MSSPFLVQKALLIVRQGALGLVDWYEKGWDGSDTTWIFDVQMVHRWDLKNIIASMSQTFREDRFKLDSTSTSSQSVEGKSF
jgi:hypothetical protein